MVRHESVSHASRTVVYSRSRMRCCVERMCGCVCVLVYVWVLINYYYYYYLKEEREASTYEAKKCQSPPGIEPGTCGLHDQCSTT